MKPSDNPATIHAASHKPNPACDRQWERLLSEAETIKAFMTANASRLARKD